MSEPDITETLSGGLVRTTIIQAVEITRQGNGGSWRIALPLVKQIVLPDGTVVDQPAAPIAFDFADLAHDAAAVELYGKLRDLTIRIARGNIKPLPKPEPIETPAEPPAQEPAP